MRALTLEALGGCYPDMMVSELLGSFADNGGSDYTDISLPL